MFSAPLVIGLLFAAPPEDAAVLARAEAAFRQGTEARARPSEARKHFSEAAQAYEELHRRGVRNADLYRNEGHAALLAGRLPQAILACRRGLRLAPDDRSLREDLERAREQVDYPPGLACRPAKGPWPPWLPWPSPELLLGLVVGWHALACVAATRWLMTRRTSGLVLTGAAGAAALFCAACWCWQQGQHWGEAEHPLVVVAAEAVPLYRGNGPSYPRHETLPALAAGMEARLRFARGEWLQIQLPGGELGWLHRDRVLLDAP